MDLTFSLSYATISPSIVWTEIPDYIIPLRFREPSKHKGENEMPVNATVTAKSGPNITSTALALTGNTGILFLPDRQVVQIFKGGDTNSPPAFEFDISAVTTITCVVSGRTLSFTIS